MTGLLILGVAFLLAVVFGETAAMWQSWQDRRDEFKTADARTEALQAMGRWH